MSEEDKQRLKECQRNYREAKINYCEIKKYSNCYRKDIVC